MPISVIINTATEQAGSILLKKATALKDEGKLTEAIEMLRKAFSEIENVGIDYGIEAFLRLPMYLQAAGRNDDAWREFNHLLTKGYPNMQKGETIWYQMESAIYDKMRLFLQREKKPKQAVIYGVLSFISMQKANVIAGGQQELFRQYFEQGTTCEALECMLAPLLKKAKIDKKSENCLQVIQRWVSALPNANDLEFEKSLSEILLA